MARHLAKAVSCLMMATTCCASSIAIAETDDACMQEDEVGCMLQIRARVPEPEHVQCTYSSTMCSGNQCCPRASETGGLTYPCPTADANFTGCENNTHPIYGIGPGAEWIHRLVQLHGAAREPEHVQCTYSSTMCSGNQCCPRASETGGLTYPCPTADANFTGCENNTHPIYGIGPGAEWIHRLTQLHGAAREPEHVQCTYSSTMCSGNQCCPRASETGGLTYPCPTADANFTGCENNTHPIYGIGPGAEWIHRLLQLHGAAREPEDSPVLMKRLEFYKRPSEMEASMADIARASKASIVNTPYSLFGQLATYVSSVRVPSDAVLFTCHNREKMRLENTDKRFIDPAFQAYSKEVQLPSEAMDAEGICHSVPADPEHMQYVLLEKKDGSQVRVMQECHAHGLIQEMCHTSEFVVIDTDALRVLDAELSKAAEQQ